MGTFTAAFVPALAAVAILAVMMIPAVSASVETATVNATTCAGVYNATAFSRACVVAAIASINGSLADSAVLELAPGNYTGGCAFGNLMGGTNTTSFAIVSANAAAIESPLDGAVFDCAGDTYAFGIERKIAFDCFDLSWR